MGSPERQDLEVPSRLKAGVYIRRGIATFGVCGVVRRKVDPSQIASPRASAFSVSGLIVKHLGLSNLVLGLQIQKEEKPFARFNNRWR